MVEWETSGRHMTKAESKGAADSRSGAATTMGVVAVAEDEDVRI